MPAAIAIPAIVGAGASVGSAAIGAHASGKAADQQAAAAERAQQFNEQVYRESKQRFNPFLQLGTDAFSRLYADHFGVPYSPQLPGAYTPGQPTLGSLSGPMMRPQDLSLDQMRAAIKGPARVMDALGGSPQAFRAKLAEAGVIPAASAEPMVTLRAPDGEIRDVPAAVADQYIAKGARRVGAATSGGPRTLGSLGQGY